MSRGMRVALAFTLVVAIVVGGLLSAGCSKESKAALVQPTVELSRFSRGSTVDFDDATINQAAAAGESGVKFGTAKKIYPSVWAANQETVANALFPAPYWKGDGDTTQYAMLTPGDQQAVDGKIFADNLTANEQDKVTEAVNGLFNLYSEEVAAAKPLEQNTAYGILYTTDNTGGMSTAWKADAQAWMTALDAYAGANYSGKTFAALSWDQRQTVMAAVFNNGAGTINPEYAFWRAMVKDSFKRGVASSMNPTLRDGIALSQFGKAYTALDCVQAPTVDAMVWFSLSTDNQAIVAGAVAGMLLSQPSLDGVFMSKGMTTAQAGFDGEVAAGINMELAFYKWLAYEGLRNNIVVGYYPTILGTKLNEQFPGQAYASLNRCDQGKVNGAVWAGLGADEQQFGGSVVAGIWGLVQAEMTDAVAIDQTTLVRAPVTGLKANTGTETSVINWKKDVEGGMAVSAAYYRWVAKEGLIALKGMGTLIRLSQAEFLFKVTNPNKYAISLDSAQFSFYVNSNALGSAVKVDTAKVAMNDQIWVPAETELLVKVVAPVKVLDMITWAVLGGKSSTSAGLLASDVWAQYQAGTQTWIISVDGYVSDDKGGNTIAVSYSIP